MNSAYRTLVWVWLALLALLLATFGSAYLPLGIWNGIANLAIAGVKAALVVLFFMRLRAHEPVPRLALMVALFTLALLVGLSLADYATRVTYVAPWQAPMR